MSYKNEKDKKKYMTKYYNKNWTKFSQQNKKYYLSHKEQILNYQKEYRQNHKQKILQYLKNWRKYNKKYSQDYNQTHKKEKAKYERQRSLKDINYKLSRYLRTRIYITLKNNYKSKSTQQLLGCAIEYFKNYIEQQFTSKMTWKNYSRFGWHIDHIKPCASFDLSKSSEQQKCFHYTNLRPLWWKENLSRPKNKFKNIMEE